MILNFCNLVNFLYVLSQVVIYDEIKIVQVKYFQFLHFLLNNNQVLPRYSKKFKRWLVFQNIQLHDFILDR